jgi:8-oxo-dGTP pyrophosphatase MutT (NUDIX family)
MRLPLQARRAAIRCAYIGLRVYWFLLRPNVVGVKCVLTSGDDVLLVRHTYGHRSWSLPGGGVKRGEVPIDAARREMHEELGHRIEDWVELGDMFVSTNHHHDHLHLFQARLADRRLDLDLTEIADAHWFPLSAPPPAAELAPDVGKILARVKGS